MASTNTKKLFRSMKTILCICYLIINVNNVNCMSKEGVGTFLKNYNNQTSRLKKISSDITWELSLGGLNKKKAEAALGMQKKANAFMRKLDDKAEQVFNETKDLKDIPEDWKRQLRLITHVATPRNVEDIKELNKVKNAMEKVYSGMRIYRVINGQRKKLQLNFHLLPMFTKVSPERLNLMLWAWTMWREAVGPRVKPKFIKMVQEANKGAQERGHKDFGEYTRSTHDMDEGKFREKTAKLMSQIAPLYRKLHAYTRFKLREILGKEMIKGKDMIPAHLLGMWPMKWKHLYKEMVPYPAKNLPDLTKKMKEKGISKLKMIKMANEFFTNIGFEDVPKTFWTKSVFKKKHKKMACQGSAFNIGQGDVRMKMPCLSVSEPSLITLHHEMGHIHYYLSYKNQSYIYQYAANPGFQEGIGDVITLSLLVPSHLKELGLLDQLHDDKEEDINFLMKQALSAIPMIPYAYTVELWRWSVFGGITTPDKYNADWWKFKNKHMGVKSPIPRPETEFDPGCFLHIDKNVEYIPYFSSQILQYTFHKALCQAAGIKKPIYKCSICKSKAAGKKLRTMLEMGRSKPWQDTLEVLTGKRDFNADAILEYYQPLEKWLDEHRKANSYEIGWTSEEADEN